MQPSPPHPTALETMGVLRERLSKNAVFRTAAATEEKAEAWCRKIRDDLKRARSGKKITQGQLASLLEFSQGTISKIENGGGDLSLKTLFRIADALRLRPVLVFAPALTVENRGGGSGGASDAEHIMAASLQHVIDAMQETMIRRMPEVMKAAAVEGLASLSSPEAEAEVSVVDTGVVGVYALAE